MKNENKKRKNSKRNSSSKETKQRRTIRTDKNSKRVTFTQNQIKQFYKEFLNEEKNYSKKKRSSNSRRLKKNNSAKRITKTKKSKRSYYRQSKLVQKDKVYLNYSTNNKTKVKDSYFRLSSNNFIDLVDEGGSIVPYEFFEEQATDILLPHLLKITNRQKKWPRFFHLMIEFFDGLDFTFFSGPLTDGFQEDIKQSFYSLLEEVYSKLPQYIYFLPSMNVTGFRFILYPIGYQPT